MGVVVKNAEKTYHTWGRTVRALDRVDLDAQSSQVTLIVGTNGSGKSTLIRAISGLLSLDSGEILIDGVQLSAIGPRAIARCRGFLQQVPAANLCPSFSIEEMIRLYLDGWAPEFLKNARAAFHGYGIALNSRVREMSGGQQQLIALELVLARRPSILLLDEPTASLDTRNSARILERVAAAAGQGVTIILVTHNIDLGLSICDKVLLMHEGHVVATWAGTSARELSASALKKSLVEIAARSLGTSPEER